MRKIGKASGVILAAAIFMVVNGSMAQAAKAGLDDAAPVAIPGYVIVGPSDSVTTEAGAFYPTGDIPEGTLVVIRNDDGSLPGGITVAQLEMLIEAQARGDVAAIEKLGFDVPDGNDEIS